MTPTPPLAPEVLAEGRRLLEAAEMAHTRWITAIQARPAEPPEPWASLEAKSTVARYNWTTWLHANTSQLLLAAESLAALTAHFDTLAIGCGFPKVDDKAQLVQTVIKMVNRLKEEVADLTAERDGLKEENWKLRGLVNAILDTYWEDGPGDIDGFWLQEEAEKHGVIVPDIHADLESAPDDCGCAEGFHCFKKADFLSAEPAAPAPRGETP